jgi:hypothetical protein
MKNLLLSILLFVGITLFACASTDALEYGADLNRGACATGFTRTAPGYCKKSSSSNLSITPSGSIGTCVNYSYATFGVPVGGKTLDLMAVTDVLSTGGVGGKNTTLIFYFPSDTTCAATFETFVVNSIYEQAATGAGSLLSEITVPVKLTINPSVTYLLNLRLSNAAGASWPTLYIIGYSD